MYLNSYFETSLFVRTVKRITDIFYTCDVWIASTWKASFTFRTFDTVILTTKIAFKNSTIGRLTEIDEHAELLNPFETSIATKWLFSKILWINEIIKNVLERSFFFAIWEKSRNNFFKSPLQTSGLVVVVAVSFNLIVTFFLGLEYAWYGILFKTVILLLGIACLFGSCSFNELMSGSLFLEKIENKNRRDQ